MSYKENNNTGKKTSKGYFVASRYKQAAESSVQSSGSREINETKVTGAERTTYKNAKKYASTPAVSGRHGFPAIDASSIIDTTGFLCVPKDNNKNVTSVGNEQTRIKSKTKSQSLKSNASQSNYPRTGSDSNAGSTSEINILYGEYLQAKLLESKILESSQKRAENASETIYKIWCLMQDLMIKNAEIYRDLSIVSHLIRLHKHFQKQEAMLTPILEIIPTLENQYRSIANAVNTVQHKLEVKNIDVSSNNVSKEEIINLLLKISKLIQSLKNMQNPENVLKAAEVSSEFLQQGKLVAEEVKRSENLLAKVNDLLLDETCLTLTQTNQL